jgi:TonB family protein
MEDIRDVFFLNDDVSHRRRSRIKSISVLGAGALLLVFAVATFAAELWRVERQREHQAEVRSFLKKKGLSDRFVPRVEGSVAMELAAVGGLVAGMGFFIWGAGLMRRQRKSPHFTVGSDPRCDCAVSESLLPRHSFRFPLVRANEKEGGYDLLYSESWPGHLEAPNGKWSLKELASSSLLADGEGGKPPVEQLEGWPAVKKVRLRPGLEAVLEMGSHRFHVSMVSAVRPFTAPAHHDWRTRLYYGASIAGHGLLLAFLLTAPEELSEMEAGSGGISPRYRKLAVESLRKAKAERMPEQKKPEEQKKRRRKRTSSSRDGADGPRDERLADRATSSGSSARTGPSHARNAGITGVLGRMSGRALASVFGRDSALSADAENSLSALVGNTVSSPYGSGLFGPAGRAGRPSGGTTVGLGTWGTGFGDGGGTPSFGPNRPTGYKVGRHETGEVTVRGRVVVDGHRSRAMIRRVIQRHVAEVRYCYVSRGLASNPKLSGQVRVRFMIAANGRVTAVAVTSRSTLSHPPTERCIRRAVRRWRFPKANGVVAVTYPFNLRPATR